MSLIVVTAAMAVPGDRDGRSAALRGGAPSAKNACLTCHAGIEEIHPGYKLTCVFCHGGDDTQTARDLHRR